MNSVFKKILKYCFFLKGITILFISCEEVIDINLNSSEPEFVIEGCISYDSVCNIVLSQTTGYFSKEKDNYIDDAIVIIEDGVSAEELINTGKGHFYGKNIIGKTYNTYKIKVLRYEVVYEASSTMPFKPHIYSVNTNKNNAQTIFNPTGKNVCTITIEFSDKKDEENFYMVRFLNKGKKIEDNYYLIKEDEANQGVINFKTDTSINYSESFFFDGGTVDVQVYSIDEPVYRYFLQLNDILYWKHRVLPPTPYNPESNINNNALGYFAAWSFDSKTIFIE